MKKILLVVSIFFLAMGGVVSAATIELPRTGQTTCYDASGGEIDCSCTGQDAATQVGAELPVPRFTTDYYGLTVVDNLTGLMWPFDSRTPDPYDPGPPICAPDARELPWYDDTGLDIDAFDYIACLNTNTFLGYNDWRLPNREELRSLIFDYSMSGPALPEGYPFINVEAPYLYWSSTSTFDWAWDSGVGEWKQDWTTGVGSMNMWSGSESGGGFVWPVRAGQTDGNPDPAYPANLRKTGQTISYASGDDGDIQAGVTWPDPRFTVTYCDASGPCANPAVDCDGDPSNDVVTDNLTGLIWIRLTDNIHRTWEESLDYANNLNRCGYSNWRLPNINELESMIHNGVPDIAVWLNTSNTPLPDYFIGIESWPHWSSTTDRAARSAAMVVDLWNGSIGNLGKAGSAYAWPVHLYGPDLTVLKTGDGFGTVTSMPPGIACGPDCSETYLEGTEVTLTAVADDGSIFEGWSGACTGTGTCTITLNTDTEVTASFSRQALLTVLKIGNGSGTVTSTPPGIDCGPDCSETYLKGTEVTLTAVPEPGSIFGGWSGACTGTGTCTITLDTDTEVTATFSKELLLTVLKTGTGSGTVTSWPSGIDCGSDCSEAFLEGTTVFLTAVADTGSVFEGWSGACTGTGLCAITLDTDTEVTASFSYEPLLLTVLKTGDGSGTVTSMPPGIDCGSDCSEAFLPGTEVTLMAVAEPGSTFEGWSGACTGTGPCIIILNTDTEITASFITPSSQCTYSISPKTYTFGIKGGALGIAVTASANPCPQPPVDSAENWIHTELSDWNGKRGTVRVVVDPSYSSVKRLSIVGIGNATFTAIQKKRSCTPGDVPPTFTPSSALWDANGGTGSFTISFAPNAAVDCAWSAQPDANSSWASTDSSGAGNGTAEYSVAENLSAAIRYGKINVTLAQQPRKIFRFKLRQLD